MDFEAYVTSLGLDPATINASQKTNLQAAWRAVHGTPTPAPLPVARHIPEPTPAAAPSTFDQKMQAIEAEAARQDSIRTAAVAAMESHKGDKEKINQIKELMTAAIGDQKTELRDFSLSLLRMDRYHGPMVFAPSTPEINQNVLEAAVCQTLKLPSLEREFQPQTLQMAHSRFRSGLSLKDLFMVAAERNGGYRGSSRDIKAMCKAAFNNHGEDFRMDIGPSSIDVSGILSNVANKFIRDAFDFVESDWRQIAAIRSVNDFKTITTYSLTGNLTYEELPAGGQIKSGTLGEETYSNAAKTYAKLLGIDRQDLINDDLGAFARVARKLGRGGALKLNDVIWTEFLDNGSFFTTGNINYDDGSDTLMDLTGMANANALFEMQTDPDGNPAGISPAIVLVPPQLWPAAFTLLSSQQLNLATSTAASTGTNSPWAGMFKLVKSRYLATTSDNKKAWYLLANPADVPVIEVAFLFGAEMPTVETGEFDFDRLGMAMRGYHDFGATKQEYRGGVKMKGQN